MDKEKRARLEKAGWVVGSTQDFLELDDAEARYIELKLALSRGLKELRSQAGLSQKQLARRLGSSQSRVSKMEAADPGISVDLLVRSIFAAGGSRRDLAGAITLDDPQPRKAERRRPEFAGKKAAKRAK